SVGGDTATAPRTLRNTRRSSARSLVLLRDATTVSEDRSAVRERPVGGTMRTHAAVLAEVDARFEVEEVDVGEPGYDEVGVRLVGTGVCHTDQVVREGSYPYRFP